MLTRVSYLIVSQIYWHKSSVVTIFCHLKQVMLKFYILFRWIKNKVSSSGPVYFVLITSFFFPSQDIPENESNDQNIAKCQTGMEGSANNSLL